MSRYRIIPHAHERIARSLATLKLTPVDPTYTPAVAAQRYQRYYMTPMRTSRRTIVWFKATLQADPHLRRALREEIRVQKLFAEYERRSHPRFDSPSYIAHHDDRGGFLWLVRRYWDGMFAGDMTEWFGDSPAFFRAVSPAQMANIVDDIGAMSSYMRRRTAPESHDLGWYMLDFHYYEQEFFAHMVRQHPFPGWGRSQTDELAEFFLRHRSFFRRHATTFTHGDLYPTNIMIRAGARRPVVLFDWELAHFNLPTFDASMLYLHAWRKPVWQKKFKQLVLQHLGDTPVNRTAWRLSTASLATRLAGFGYIRLHNTQPHRYRPLPTRQRATITKLYQYYMGELRASIDGSL